MPAYILPLHEYHLLCRYQQRFAIYCSIDFIGIELNDIQQCHKRHPYEDDVAAIIVRWDRSCHVENIEITLTTKSQI